MMLGSLLIGCFLLVMSWFGIDLFRTRHLPPSE